MSDCISRRAAIQAIDDLPNCYNGYSDTYDKAYIIGVLEELPSVDVPDRKVGKWIPCKKQMPKPNETVNYVRKYYLVQNEYGDMMVASYNAKGDTRWWEQMYKYEPTTDKIVAWMELPEEYKEGGEDEHTD